jgi:hypothetical protein
MNNGDAINLASPLIYLFFNNSNNPTATVNAIAFTNANGFIFFIMRDQALVTKLLDVNVAVDNENTNLANVDSVALFNKDLVAWS